MIDHDVARRREQLHEVAVAAPRPVVDTIEQIVDDFYAIGLKARLDVVRAENAEPGGDVANGIHREPDVLDLAPGTSPVLISDGQQNRVPRLRCLPVAFHDVALDDDVAGVFQLEQVLHLPPTVAVVPLERFRERVRPHHDVRRRQIRYSGIRSAEDDVLSCSFEIVVLNDVIAGSVPSGDRL